MNYFIWPDSKRQNFADMNVYELALVDVCDACTDAEIPAFLQAKAAYSVDTLRRARIQVRLLGADPAINSARFLEIRDDIRGTTTKRDPRAPFQDDQGTWFCGSSDGYVFYAQTKVEAMKLRFAHEQSRDTVFPTVDTYYVGKRVRLTTDETITGTIAALNRVNFGTSSGSYDCFVEWDEHVDEGYFGTVMYRHLRPIEVGKWSIEKGTVIHGKVEADRRNYGGWSEGDVMAYLSRFGHPVKQAGVQAEWIVIKRLFKVSVTYRADAGWSATVYCHQTCGGLFKPTLPEAMQWAVQRWRELVAESDLEAEREPTADEVAASLGMTRHGGSWDADGFTPAEVRHIGTGDMGQRSNWSGGWGGRDE